MSIDEQLAAERQAEAQRTHYVSLASPRSSNKKRQPLPLLKTPRRNGDRHSGDDDDDAGLPVLCRFRDLQAAGITDNWPHLLRMIDNEAFPEGILLSRNIRAWPVAEVRRWLAARPTARKVVNPRRVIKEKEVA
jgi:predicted DNA-binding transcriptional regulator AlpA